MVGYPLRCQVNKFKPEVLKARWKILYSKETTQLAACDFAVRWPPWKDRREMRYCSRKNITRLK